MISAIIIGDEFYLQLGFENFEYILMPLNFIFHYWENTNDYGWIWMSIGIDYGNSILYVSMSTQSIEFQLVTIEIDIRLIKLFGGTINSLLSVGMSNRNDFNTFCSCYLKSFKYNYLTVFNTYDVAKTLLSTNPSNSHIFYTLNFNISSFNFNLL